MKPRSILFAIITTLIVLMAVNIFPGDIAYSQASGVTTTAASGTIKRTAETRLPVIAYWDSVGNTIYMVNGNYPLAVAPPKWSAVVYSDSVVIADTSKTVLTGDDKYLSITLTNDADSTIYLRLGTTAARVNSGIRLAAGSSITFGVNADIPYTGSITGISAAHNGKKLLRTVVRKK